MVVLFSGITIVDELSNSNQEISPYLAINEEFISDSDMTKSSEYEIENNLDGQIIGIEFIDSIKLNKKN